MTGANRHGFVGRSTELGQLAAARRYVAAGSSRIVVVEGVAGIGKTALVRAFLARIPDTRSVWVSADADELTLELEFARQLGRHLHKSADVTRSSDPFTVGAALLAGIGALQDAGPVVLVLDDLHWVDPASGRALLFLLRRLDLDGILVILAVRPHGIEHLGPGWERLLADDVRTEWIRLGGLDAGDIARLAAVRGRAVSLGTGARLRDHTAGNPLYVSALLTELPTSALREEGSALPAPHSYAATVLVRLARLSRPARDLVGATAILGVHPSARTVQRLAGIADDAAFAAAADESVRAGLLQWRQNAAVNEDIGFTHPLDRAAVHDDLAPALRRSLHRDAATLVDGPARFEHRVAATTGVADEELAADLIAEATRSRAGGAVTTSARYLFTAARITADPELSDRCLFDAVELLLLSGDLSGAVAYREVVESRPESPRMRYTTAIILAGLGEIDASVGVLQSVLSALDPVADSATYGRCAAVLAYLAGVGGDDSAAVEWSTRARGVAPELDVVASLASQALAWGYVKSGRAAEALDLLADVVADTTDPSPFDTEALAVRGVVRIWAGTLEAGVADLREVTRRAQHDSPPADIALVYAALAEGEFHLDDWVSAARHVNLAVSFAEDLGHPWYLPYERGVAAQLAAAQGDITTATAHATAAQQASTHGPSADMRAFAVLARAHVAAAQGDWPTVAALLGGWQDGGAGVRHPGLQAWRVLLAEAFVEAGDPTAALRLLDPPMPDGWGGVAATDRERVLGRALHRRGDDAAAARVFEAAATGADVAGWSKAKLALEHGRFLLATGDVEAARVRLAAARRAFAGSGASLIVACDDALALAGTPGVPHDNPPVRFAGLTAREQDVAELVARGLTNREVAAELYVSVKAVEFHLSNVFGKLQLRSRRDLRVL